MDIEYKCLECGGKLKFERIFTNLIKRIQMIEFSCRKCRKVFQQEDKGFGYQAARTKMLKEKYP